MHNNAALRSGIVCLSIVAMYKKACPTKGVRGCSGAELNGKWPHVRIIDCHADIICATWNRAAKWYMLLCRIVYSARSS